MNATRETHPALSIPFLVGVASWGQVFKHTDDFRSVEKLATWGAAASFVRYLALLCFSGWLPRRTPPIQGCLIKYAFQDAYKSAYKSALSFNAFMSFMETGIQPAWLEAGLVGPNGPRSVVFHVGVWL